MNQKMQNGTIPSMNPFHFSSMAPNPTSEKPFQRNPKSENLFQNQNQQASNVTFHFPSMVSSPDNSFHNPTPQANQMGFQSYQFESPSLSSFPQMPSSIPRASFQPREIPQGNIGIPNYQPFTTDTPSSIPFQIELSPSPKHSEPENFSLCNGKIYLVHLLNLTIFSNKINQMALCNPCLRSITIPPPENPIIISFIQYIYGEGCDINPQNYMDWHNLAIFLEVPSILSRSSLFLLENLRPQVAIDRILSYFQQKNPNLSFAPFALQSEIIYLAQNFGQLYNEITQLPLLVIDQIISRLILRNEAEIFMYNWISMLISHEKQYYSLFVHIHFENLPPKVMQEFAGKIDLDMINGSLWFSIRNRFVNFSSDEPERLQTPEFRPLKDIISSSQVPNNSFENIPNVHPFENIPNVHPFENIPNVHPFENISNVHPFENIMNIQPADNFQVIQDFQPLNQMGGNMRQSPYEVNQNYDRSNEVNQGFDRSNEVNQDSFSGEVDNANVEEFRPFSGKQRKQYTQLTSVPFKGDLWNGIIESLRDDRDPDFEDVIKMEAAQQQRYLLQLLNYENFAKSWNNWNGETFVKEDAWFIIEFLNLKISLSSYSLSCSVDRINFFQPKHWVLYGSNDRVSWEVLDEEFNATSMNDENPQSIFDCTKKKKKKNAFYSCFKFKMIENFIVKKTHLINELTLSGIEFFGEVQPK